MSSAVTNRVYLPDGKKIYVTDDVWGDERLEQLYSTYGNLKVEACHKEWGKNLHDMEAFWSGTIGTFWDGEGDSDEEREVTGGIGANKDLPRDLLG